MNLYGYTEDLCPSDQVTAKAVFPLGISFRGLISIGMSFSFISFLLDISSIHKAHLQLILSSLGSIIRVSLTLSFCLVIVILFESKSYF
jgi:hypothetical protein